MIKKLLLSFVFISITIGIGFCDIDTVTKYNPWTEDLDYTLDPSTVVSTDTLTGLAFLANDQVFTGTNTFTLPILADSLVAQYNISAGSMTMVNTVDEFSTDGTLGGDSDSAIPTEKAVKTYVDTEIVIDSGTAQGQMVFWDNTTLQWENTETNELFWDDTGKNVGIGTNSPSGKLDVNGDIIAGTTMYAPIGDFDHIYVSSITGNSDIYVLDNIDMQDNDLLDVGNIGTSGDRATKGWFTDIESTNMPTVGGTSINANSVLNLTSAEVTQLANIDSNTISNTQWGYLGVLDQNLRTTDNVTFNNTDVDGTLTMGLGVNRTGSNLTLNSNNGLIISDSSGGGMYLNTTAGILTITASSSNLQLNGTTIILNSNNANADTIIRGDTDTNLFYVDAFNNTVNIGQSSGSGKFNVTGNITITSGDLGLTGSRVTKGWFTDIESTNMPTVGGTSIQTTFADAGANTDITSLRNTSLSAGRDADNFIDWSTDNQLDIRINAVTTSINSISTGASDNDKLVTQGYVDDKIYPSFQYFADQLDTPNNSDWTVNALANLQSDSNNAAFSVRNFDDTTEEGVGFSLYIPVNASSMTLTFVSRAETAPVAARTVGVKLYERGLPSTVDAWSAGTALTDIDISTNENWVKDTQTDTLSNWGITTGQIHQFELTRVDPTGGTELTGDWVLYLLMVEFE